MPAALLMQVKAACSSLRSGLLDVSLTTSKEFGANTAAPECICSTTWVRAEHRRCLQEAGADTAAFKRSLQDVDAKAARQLTGELTRAGAAVYDALQHERELREVRQRWVTQCSACA